MADVNAERPPETGRLETCDVCGVAVWDAAAHERWHQELAEAYSWARSGRAAADPAG